MKHFYVLCALVESGMIPSERTVTIRGYKADHEEYVRGAADSIRTENGKQYMYISVIRQDPATKAWLIQFPVEADSGAYRMWVPESSVISLSPSMVPA